MAKCVGCGLEVNNGILEVATCANGGLTCEPAGDPDCPDGGLSVLLCPTGGIQKATAANPGPNGCTDGLYVQFPTTGHDPIFPPNPDGTQKPAALGNCLNTDATGRITVQLDTTPAACNGIECGTEGLRSPCVQNIMEIDQMGIGPAVTNVNALGSATFNFTGDDVWTIENVFCCGAARGLFIVEASGPVVDNMSNNFLARLTYQFSIDGGAFGGIFPEHVQWFDNRGGPAGRRESMNLWHETFKVFEGSLPNTGSLFTYLPRFQLVVLQGTATVRTDLAASGFELHTHMHQSDNFPGTVNRCHSNDCVIAPNAPLDRTP